jgi:hypothetical protein
MGRQVAGTLVRGLLSACLAILVKAPNESDMFPVLGPVDMCAVVDEILNGPEYCHRITH